MKKIGLTGVMGAGKSSVIAILKECSITVLDCDEINAKLLETGEAGYQALVARFGDVLLDDTLALDKQSMSDLIFSDPVKRKAAEAMLHPLIKEAIQTELVKHRDESLVVVEVPLLFEVQWESFFDEIWVVASEEAILLDRLAQYRKVSEQEARRRLAAQMPQQEKIAKAHVVLWNNGGMDSLKQQIYAILESFRMG